MYYREGQGANESEGQPTGDESGQQIILPAQFTMLEQLLSRKVVADAARGRIVLPVDFTGVERVHAAAAIEGREGSAEAMSAADVSSRDFDMSVLERLRILARSGFQDDNDR